MTPKVVELRQKQKKVAAQRYADAVNSTFTSSQPTGQQRAMCIVDFKAGWEYADITPRWVSIEDEVPPTDDLVLIGNRDDVALGYYHEFHWFYSNFRPAQPTHWMPLPAPPECKIRTT